MAFWNSVVVPPPRSSTARHVLRHPENHTEWCELYAWLAEAYAGDPYSDGDRKSMHLFRALDDNREEIAATTRLVNDARHIIDTDAAALSGGQGLTLELAGAEDDVTIAAGEAVWARAKVKSRVMHWARMCATLGDFHLEAVRVPSPSGGWTTTLLYRDPQNVRLDYDPIDGTRIVRAVITVPHYDPPEVDGYGVYSEPVGHTYVRVVDDKEVKTYLDGVLVPEQSGPHRLGVVPLVHVPFLPFVDLEHGFSAAHHVYRAVAYADSTLAQSQAITTRYADPHIVVKGARLTAGHNGERFGRYYHGLPTDASIEYLETSLAGVGSVLELLTRIREMVREAPEFMFTETGANASGTALSFRASAFEAKMAPIRVRFFDALATATDYAVRMERMEAHDPGAPLFRVTGGPILPVNRNDEVQMLSAVKQNNGLTDDDYIAHMQRLGIVGDQHMPADYVVKVRAGIAAMVATLGPEAAQLAEALNDQPPSDASAPGPTDIPVEAPPDVEPGEAGDPNAPLVDTAVALNGAQVTAALDIVGRVVEGQLPRDVGVRMLSAFFNLPEETAEDIMGSAGRGFKPKPTESP